MPCRDPKTYIAAGGYLKNNQWLRNILGLLQVFIGLGAIPPGIIFIVSPQGWPGVMPPVSMLANSPFSDFLIPGMFLLLFNGVGSLVAAYLTFRSHRYAALVAMGFGLFLIVWISAQIYWFETVLFLHIFYFSCGVVELALGTWLLSKERT